MTFVVDLQNEFTQGYKSFAIIGSKAIISFGPSEWAPGIWAGTEGFVLKHSNNHFKIVKVDFDKRILECERAYLN